MFLQVAWCAIDGPGHRAQVKLQLNPDGKPESGNDIARRVTVQGELNDEQRAQLLEVANASPMHKLLTGEIVS